MNTAMSRSVSWSDYTVHLPNTPHIPVIPLPDPTSPTPVMAHNGIERAADNFRDTRGSTRRGTAFGSPTSPGGTLRDHTGQSPKINHTNLAYTYDGTNIIHVQRARLRAEVISLNWVLTCQDGPRGRMAGNAILYREFDMIFKPDIPHPHRLSSCYGMPGARIVDMQIGRYSRDRDQFQQPASTHCTLYRMSIIVNNRFEWSTTVRQSTGIRCIDVFKAIYRMFQVPMTDRELAMLSGQSLHRCTLARYIRFSETSMLHRHSNKILRIDWFGEYCYFRGLTQKEDVWILDTCNRLGQPSPLSRSL